MLIREMFKKGEPIISFEIFPPKKDYPIETIYETIGELADLKPDFISVTYGAGGATVGKTVEIASIIKNKFKLEALAHLTCVNSSPEEMDRILDQLQKNNIKNVLALRGDLPQDVCPSEAWANFNYAKDLVSHIKKRDQDFSVAGACYPEGHMECPDLDKDLVYLKEKIDCGTDFLISQLFFDNQYYYDFMEKAAKLGIDTPVLAGIMPVLNKKQVERIVGLCGASLPKKFTRIIERYENSPEALKEAGIAYATEQIIDLLSWGIDGIHIYTMNRPKITREIVENITEVRNFKVMA